MEQASKRIPGFVWEGKMKNTKIALKERAKKNLKNPSHPRKEACNTLLDTQIEMDNVQVQNSDMEKEAKLQAEVYKEYRKEEEY